MRLGMDLGGSFMKHRGIRRWMGDLAILPFLGVAAYFLFQASALLRPGEAAVLMMVAAGLVLTLMYRKPRNGG